GAVVPALQDNRAVAAIASGTVTELDVAGSRVSGFALDPVRGSVQRALLDGRSPRRDNEIALGAQTSRETGAGIGDRVAVSIGGKTAQMLVVGRMVFPNIGDNGQLGRGAHITF